MIETREKEPSTSLQSILQTKLERYAGYYANYYEMSTQDAQVELREYGVVDFILRWYHVLGHASPQQIARRLHGIVEERKRLRREAGL